MNLLTSVVALCPPKPNELFIAAFTVSSRAWLAA